MNGKLKIIMINEKCTYFPCHGIVEDCTFCYCPLYPCKIKEFGVFIKDTSIWDCSNCTFVHKIKNVNNLKNHRFI